MSVEENRQLAIRGYEMFKNGDIPGILDQSTDDIQWISNDIKQIPFAGTFQGKQGVAEFFTKLSEASEVLLFEPQEFIAERDKVVVLGTGKWKVRKTGVTYDDTWVHVFTMRDGKIARFRIYGNSAAILAAFTTAGESKPDADPEAIAASMAH